MAASFGLLLGLARGLFLGTMGRAHQAPFWPTVGLGLKVTAPWYVAAFVLGATADYFTPPPPVWTPENDEEWQRYKQQQQHRSRYDVP